MSFCAAPSTAGGQRHGRGLPCPTGDGQRRFSFEICFFQHLTFCPLLDSKMKPASGRINHVQEVQLVSRTKQKYSQEDAREGEGVFALRVIFLQTQLGGEAHSLGANLKKRKV